MPLEPSPSLPSPRINGSAVIAASAVSFALIVSVIAWIVTHPTKAARPAEPSPFFAALSEAPADRPMSTPVSLAAPAPEASPAIQASNRQDVVLNHVPVVEDAPPLLPSPPARESEQAAEPANAGETYGTSVLFRNNSAAAAETARREKKLLFVMHISGNFEDACFT